MSSLRQPVQPDLTLPDEPGLRIPDWIVLVLFFGVFVVTVVPLGRFMVKVIKGEPHILSPLTAPLEHRLLAWSQVKADDEMDWKTFAIAMMVFSLIGIIFLFLLQLAQPVLPLNPAGVGSPSWDLALNTAVSFVTNTNWQAYAGETGVSYLTQMIGLCVQNFTSAATGMAVLVGLTYGLSRRSASTIGNFWVLLIRSVMILLPISIIIALILVSQGTVQTLSGPVTVPLLDPVRDASGALVTTQTIPLGPAASQIAIKQLGVNGGGFFNTNSAHPFENPTPFSNFIEIIAILLIPAALCYSFGRMVGAGRKGVSILIAMTLIFLPLLGLAIWAELGGNPAFDSMGIDQTTTDLQPGGNMEGKEVRFGIMSSALFSVVTTSASCGAVNSMHDSFTPLGGFCPAPHDAVRGGGLRRYRVRPVRHARLCDHRDVHCRADGRADTGISRQEDRAAGNDDCHHHHPHPHLPDPHRYGGRGSCGSGKNRSPQSGPPWFLGDPVCLHLCIPE